MRFDAKHTSHMRWAGIISGKSTFVISQTEKEIMQGRE
jgi:hypothetical protein